MIIKNDSFRKEIIISALQGATLAWILKDPITFLALSGRTFSGRSILIQISILLPIFCSCFLLFHFLNRLFEKNFIYIEKISNKFRLFTIGENYPLYITGVIGIILRIRQYIFARSLWFDELSLAHNFLNHDLLFLLTKPLDTGQSAPIGFIVLSEIIGEIFNYSDLSLRLFPFLSGIGIIILSVTASRFFTSPLSRVVFVWLMSTSPLLIYYSNEFKPYIIDVFIYLLLLVVYLNYRERKINIVLVAVIGVLAILFSYSSVIVLSAFVIAEFLLSINQNRKTSLKTIVLVSMIWLIVFVYIYLGFSRKNSPMEYFLQYWGNRFAPIPISIKSLHWYWNSLLEFSNLGYHPGKPIGAKFFPGIIEPINVFLAGITCLGAFYQYKQNKKIAVFNICILLISLIISAFRLYPFGSRLNLYTIPIAYSFLCYLLVRLSSRKSPIIRLLGYQLIVITLAINTFSSVNAFLNPVDNADIKNALIYLQNNAVPSDSIAMVDNTYPAYKFYNKNYDLPKFVSVSSFSRPFDIDTFQNHLCINQASDRVWILITQLFFESKEFIAELSEIGTLLDKWESSGSGLYYFQFDLEKLCQ